MTPADRHYRRARWHLAAIAAVMLIAARGGWSPIVLPTPSLTVALPTLADAPQTFRLFSLRLSIAIDVQVRP